LPVIKVGAATEVELKERKHRIEDAVRNAKAAVEEGIVAGGGVALVQAGKTAFDKLDLLGRRGDRCQHRQGRARRPAAADRRQRGPRGRRRVGEGAQPRDRLGPRRCDGEYVNMLKAGIIDPAKVTRSALQNAASIAGLFLTTEAVVADKPEKEKAPAAPGGGDMDF
jgi:chaperonin GroEL